MERLHDYRFEWDEQRLAVTMSVGLVPITKDTDSTSSLMQCAESSCTVAKDIGGNRVQIYHSSHTRLSQRNEVMKWVARIDRALDEGTLHLRCQRIMPIQQTVPGADYYEILLGMTDEQGKPVSAQDFIKAAEWYNRVPEVDRWVIRNTFRWIADNREMLSDIGAFSINLSGRSLNDEGLMASIVEEIKTTKVSINKICFEITETAGIANLSDAGEFIARMKQHTGCMFSLDDFGTGLSSYAYLKDLPVDFLKIDGAFVRDMVNEPNDYAVVKSIAEIGHFMGKKVIAEYVEDDITLEHLRTIGVDYVQGFGVAKPIRLDELLR